MGEFQQNYAMGQKTKGVVLTHVGADFDTLAAAVGLAALRDFETSCRGCTSVVLPQGANPAVTKFLALHKHYLPIRNKKVTDPSKLKWLGIVDNQRKERLGPCSEWVNLASEVQIFDHHVDQTCNIKGELVVEDVGSATTVIVEKLAERNIKVNTHTATLLALGIHSDTGNLIYECTTARDAAALQYCLENGASQKAILQFSRPKYHNGAKIVYVHIANDEYEPGMSTVAQDVLKLTNSDVLLMGVSYINKSKKASYQLASIIGRASASLDDINLNHTLGSLNGGGHPKAAAASIRMDRLDKMDPEMQNAASVEEILEKLVEKVCEAVPPVKCARELMTHSEKLVVNADWQKKLDKVVQESAAEQRKHAQELQEKDSKLSHLEAELAEATCPTTLPQAESDEGFREKGIEEGNEVEEDGKGSGTAVQGVGWEELLPDSMLQEEKEETREGGTSDVAISSHLNPGTLSAACDTQELQKKLSHLNTILTVKSTRIYDLQEELRASHKAHTEEVEKMKQAHEKALQKTLDDHKTSTTELKEQLKRAAERSTAAGNAVQLESELAEWKSKATRWYAELISMREWKEQTNAVPDTTRTSSDVVEALNFSNLLFGNPAAAEVVRDEPDQPELEAPLSSPRLPAEELGELMPDLAACKAAQRRIEKSSTPSDRGDTMSNSSLNSYNSELTDGQRRKSSLSGYSRKLSGSGVLTGRDVKTLSPEILAARNEAKAERQRKKEEAAKQLAIENANYRKRLSQFQGKKKTSVVKTGTS
eukprot:gene3619-4551_t